MVSIVCRSKLYYYCVYIFSRRNRRIETGNVCTEFIRCRFVFNLILCAWFYAEQKKKSKNNNTIYIEPSYHQKIVYLLRINATNSFFTERAVYANKKGGEWGEWIWRQSTFSFLLANGCELTSHNFSPCRADFYRLSLSPSLSFVQSATLIGVFLHSLTSNEKNMFFL